MSCPIMDAPSRMKNGNDEALRRFLMKREKAKRRALYRFPQPESPVTPKRQPVSTQVPQLQLNNKPVPGEPHAVGSEAAEPQTADPETVLSLPKEPDSASLEQKKAMFELEKGVHIACSEVYHSMGFGQRMDAYMPYGPLMRAKDHLLALAEKAFPDPLDQKNPLWLMAEMYRIHLSSMDKTVSRLCRPSGRNTLFDPATKAFKRPLEGIKTLLQSPIYSQTALETVVTQTDAFVRCAQLYCLAKDLYVDEAGFFKEDMTPVQSRDLWHALSNQLPDTFSIYAFVCACPEQEEKQVLAQPAKPGDELPEGTWLYRNEAGVLVPAPHLTATQLLAKLGLTEDGVSTQDKIAQLFQSLKRSRRRPFPLLYEQTKRQEARRRATIRFMW
eukprot:TRINITY_DN11555_c4_g2_i2.p1 TRINITY_DN11555_c4_g2~~TRINITY_DN11555_c4_g2_i2.p1  ORF type:complete len:386 (+),score=65.59 TRINITY_DN11555_c4_g2_i2:100-1257(+)